MARITVEDCLETGATRFELVIIASKRARQIARDAADPFVAWENDKATVVALREIAEGYIDKSILGPDTKKPATLESLVQAVVGADPTSTTH